MASGTITGTTYISNHYYLKLVWTSTSNPKTNKSSVTAKLYFHAGSGWPISISNHAGTIVVNGSTKSITGSVSSVGDTLLASYDNVSVTHASDGTKSINLSATYQANVTISGHGTIGTMTVPSTSVALDNIDRAAPVITASVTYGTSGSVTIAGSTTVACSSWQYKVDSGSWTSLSSSSGVTSASKTISLATGTSYTVTVRATRDYNEVTGSKAVTVNLNPPTVTGSVTYLGSGNIKLTANSNVTADKWEYKIGSGAWTQYSTTASTSQQTGTLSPGSGSYTTYVRATRQLNNVIGTSSAFTVDLTAPTVTLALSNATTTSVKLTITTTYSCNKWEYRFKEGSGSYSAYTTFDSTAGTSKTYTQTGLGAGKTYTFQVRATRTSNLVAGTSSAKSATTVGASVLTSVPTLQIDNTTTIALGITVYSTSFYHKLTIKDGGTTVGSVNIGTISSTGSVTQSVNLSSIKTAILNAMTTVTSKSFTFRIGTYSDSGYTTQIGSNSDKSGTVKVSSTYSAPTFTGGLTLDDTNLTIKGLTGGDAYVQELSQLKVTFSSATAKNQATISSYTTSVGGDSKTGSSPVSFGSINTNGASTAVTVTAKDSRGFTKTQSDTIDVIEYYKPEISQLTIARVNNYEDVAVLNIDGSYSPAEFNGSPLNSIPSDQITYRMKEVGGSWGAYQAITLTVDPSDQTFTYSSNTFENGNLDRTKEYEFEFVITDALGGSITISRNVPDGTPVMSLRKGRVGINEPDPQYPLDVSGDTNINGILYGQTLTTFPSAGVTSPAVYFREGGIGAGTIRGRTYFERDGGTDPRRFYVSSRLNDDTHYENYRFPNPNLAGTANVTYDILTTKTVALNSKSLLSATSVASGVTPTNLLSITGLASGVYIITAQIGYDSSSGGTYRALYIGTSATGFDIARVQIAAPSNATPIYINASNIVTVSGTIYLNGLQNSGSSINARATDTYINAIRIL